jgi:hypothetical protein
MDRNGETDLIEKLISAGIANHYNSDQMGSLHAIPHSKSSCLKILESETGKSSFKQDRFFLSVQS